MRAQHHHELITSEAAGALVLAFIVLLRPVATAIAGSARKTLDRLTGRKDKPTC